MRVLTFLHSFEPGGVERDALRLNAEWARLGVDVQIALGRRDGRLAQEAPALPYTVFQTGRISTAAFETLWMIAKLPGAIRAQKPDILFCAGNTYSIVAVTTRLFLGRACPPIILKVSNDLERRDLPAPMRWAYHLWLRIQRNIFDAVVAMAEPALQEIKAVMRVDPARIHVIENASLTDTDLTAFATARDAANRTHKGRHFLSVGRLALQKNFALLLRAFARIATADDRLTIIGEGGQRGKLEALIRSLGLSDRVSLPGHANPLYDAFAQADAFVLASDYEGLGVVVIEALAAGIPIAVTDCCVNMPMLVADAGQLVPIKNVGALATAMDSIVTTPVDPAAMRARAARFTVERTGPQWLALFESLKASC